MSIAALIVAAGRGVRFGTDCLKQFALLRNKPILFHSIEIFENMGEFDQIWLVLPEDFMDELERRFDLSPYKKIGGWVAGGARRQDSVWAGLSNLPDETEIVAIHDAVRPCAPAAAISQAVRRARQAGAAILAAPVLDTLKRCDDTDHIVETIERNRLWLAQTPQVFRFDLVRRAFRKVLDDQVEITDDAAAVERLGGRVEVVRSDWPNPKITTPPDARLAELLLREKGQL